MKKKLPISEEQLKQMFEENFERLKMENGHSLSPHVKMAAWYQVQMYWHKLSSIALGVTDTEVQLSLPNKRTKKKKTYCIEGVVDIVREGDKVTMYDIKTHDANYVRKNTDSYHGQINVYSHIWQKLRGEKLDETAIIATRIPEELLKALDAADDKQIEVELKKWQPVISIPFSESEVEKTIGEFGDVVDKIQDNEFRPVNVRRLNERDGQRDTFATRVCRNCDARFSCDSYRKFAKLHYDKSWVKLADFYDMPPDEEEEIERVEDSLSPDVDLTKLDEDL